MNHFYVETEPKLFCLLILVFLYVFQARTLQYQRKTGKLLYGFTLIEILFSIFGGIAQNEIWQTVCFAVCGVSSFLAIYFGGQCALNMTENKLTFFKKALCILVCALCGVLSFYSLKNGINATAFLMTFVIVALFALEQHNKIRVDKLTKLYNRYGMDVELKEQLRQYEREHSDSFYIISCDLDNFKHINDTWGHAEGDRALVLIAGVLAKIGKKFDSAVFRIGGDEFIIITDKSEEGLATEITNALKAELDKIDFRDDFDIKMSIGVSLYDGITSIDDLLNNADKKMYEAKRSEKKI